MATVALFSVLPFAVFLNDNKADLDPDATLALWALVPITVGLLAVAIADRLGGPVARERAAVVFAAIAFLFFHFQLADSIAEAFGAYSDLAAFVVWLVLLAAVVALAAILSRRRAR